jgi:hypothetical protein
MSQPSTLQVHFQYSRCITIIDDDDTTGHCSLKGFLFHEAMIQYQVSDARHHFLAAGQQCTFSFDIILFDDVS